MIVPGDYGSLLDTLAGVSWPARKPFGSGVAGTHPSRLRGMTAEFTEYRPYRQGDDPRRLDWKLLARTDRAYLRITDDHATRSTLVLLDASASMAFPAPSSDKWRQACRIALGLASVARADGDPVGLMIPRDNSETWLRPSSRRGVLAEMTHAIAAVNPEGSPSLPRGIPGIRKGWRLAIISDFLGEENDLLRESRQLIVNGIEVFALHVIAREEIEPAATTRLATDPEHPEIRRVLHEGSAAEYVTAFAGWRASLADRWRRSGAEYTEVIADEDTASVIRRVTHGISSTVAG